MHKISKRIFASVLIVVLFVCAFFCVNKNPNVEAVTEDDGVIYYSELFYGYPHCVANDPYFNSYSSSINNVYDTVYSAYKNSSLVVGTGLENALDKVTSPTEVTKLITDVLGLTDFSYNDALDAANHEFVKHILSDSVANDLGATYGKTTKMVKELNFIVSVFNGFATEDENGEKYTAEYFFRQGFSLMKGKGYLSFFLDSMLDGLWAEINNKNFSLSNCFKLATTEIDIAKAMLTSIAMEDIRLEIVNDILSTQSEETVLKQGMTRLKSELQKNFITHFIDKYLKEKLADELFGKIDKFVVNAVGANELKLVISIVKKAFNNVYGVPKFADVLKWQVLICYSKDLANSIPFVASAFIDGPFLSNQILNYEKLFIGYDAINKATMAQTEAVNEMLDPFGEAYGVFSEALDNNIETITLKSGLVSTEVPSTTTDKELYKYLSTGVIMSLEGETCMLGDYVEVSNGISTVKIPRKATTLQGIFNQCISESTDAIFSFKDSYGLSSLYSEHINSAKNLASTSSPILKEVYSSYNYQITSSSILLKNDAEEVLPDCIYGLNNTILGNITIISDKTLTISKNTDISVDGNILVGRGADREEGGMIVEGNLTVKGTLTLYLHSEIRNDGELVVEEELNCSSAYGSKIINNAKIDVNDCTLTNKEFSYVSTDGSELYVSGDLAGNGKPMGGSIILDGSKIQTINNFYSSHILDVQNKNGLNYVGTVYISGWYKLNNNPLVLNSNETYAYNGARFDDSYYEIIRAFDLILLDSVNASIVLGDKMTLTIPKDTNITVKRNIYIGSSDGHQKGTMIVEGNLTVKGTLTLYLHSEIRNDGELVVEGELNCSSAYGSKIINNAKIDVNDCTLTNKEFSYVSTDGSELYVSGDFTGNGKAMSGSAIFNGTEKQSVNKLNASTVVLKNESESGVVFTSTLSVSVLFNHNQNKFTLYNNGKDSAFVDYDGDGIKDNLDSYPTDPLNGQNDSGFQLKMFTSGQASYLEIVGYNGDDINIVVPDSIAGYPVTSIADGAFAGCSIESVFIRKSISKIGNSAFNNAEKLRAFEVSGDNTVYSSADGILYSFDKTVLIRYPVAKEKTAFIIPDSVTTIEENTFNGTTYLESVDMPESVTEIGSDSFDVTSIAIVNYAGCEREWNAVNKAFDSGLSALIVRFDEFTATFICDGETLSQTEYKAGKTIIIPENIPDKKYYTFIGWTPELYETMPEYDIEFTAVWELSEATRLLEFYVDDELYFSEYRFEGEEVTIPESPSKEGYTFIEWSSDVVDVMPDGDIRYDAVWNINVYQVSFVVDGVVYNTYDCAYSDELTVPVDPSKDGYTFFGWTPVVPETMPDIPMTFTADLEPIVYTATFVADGAVISTQTFTVETESLDEPPVPQKAGYYACWSGYELEAMDITIVAKYYLPEAVMISKRTLDVGDTYRLLPSCNFEVTDKSWMSSDTSVATVNKYGKVTAVGEGECRITVTCYGKDSIGNDVQTSKSTKIIVNDKSESKNSFRELFDELFEVTLHDLMFNIREFMKVLFRYVY